jgi:putative transposase
MLAGLIPSVGTVGDALDNALAETTIGLYKTECVREGSPFRTGPLRTLADLEDVTSAWVPWYNASRLMHRWAVSHRQKPKPRTTLNNRSGTTPITRNEVYMKTRDASITCRRAGRAWTKSY